MHDFPCYKGDLPDFQNPRAISAVVPKRAITLDEASTEASPHSERLEPVKTGTSRCHVLMVVVGHLAEETTLPADSLV